MRWPLVVLFLGVLLRRDLYLIWKNIVKRILRARRIPTPWGCLEEGEVALPGPVAPLAIPAVEGPLDQFPTMARKILATLWHYQKKTFGDEPGASRWEFLVTKDSPEAAEFERAANRLLFVGLVAFDPSSEMYFLTSVGIVFCRAHDAELAQAERFRFPND